MCIRDSDWSTRGKRLKAMNAGTERLKIEENPRNIFERRFTYFVFNCLTKEAEVKCTDGTTTHGNLFCADIETGGVVLKNALTSSNGKEGTWDDSRLLRREDIVYMRLQDIGPPTAPRGGASKAAKTGKFKTDGEISGAGARKKKDERDFVKWTGSNRLEASGDFDLGGAREGWDQFKANKDRFGVMPSFEEEKYHRPIDYNSIDPERLRYAAEVEQQIIREQSDNRHVAEDRGQVDLKDYDDEEDMYSAVVRGSGQMLPLEPLAPPEVFSAAPPKFVNTRKETKAAPKPTPAPAPAQVQTPVQSQPQPQPQPPAQPTQQTLPATQTVTKAESVSKEEKKEEPQTPKKVLGGANAKFKLRAAPSGDKSDQTFESLCLRNFGDIGGAKLLAAQRSPTAQMTTLTGAGPTGGQSNNAGQASRTR
eukprot:TRINITY_DN6706_c0_g3_i8.p1 TRINITY_DN6706_c0_g3~~TRINITY_DN6706_c0_g3_i8.p1  ORF type:complete len:422 (-),score=116.40 TRINITY_DN6706_c0_g3_i8:120-1385(-)